MGLKRGGPGRRTATRLAIAAPIAALHVALFALLPAPDPPDMEAAPPADAVVVDLPAPPPPPPPLRVAEPAPRRPPSPAKADPPRGRPSPPVVVARTSPAAPIEPIPASPEPPGDPDSIIEAAALAGAAGAGDGSGGGSGGVGEGRCDMVRRLQDALRRDPQVAAAVAEAHRPLSPGQALMVWNGRWLRSPGQDGKGLAGLRQAIALEVAFAPEACRRQAMRGLVVIAFSDRPSGPRVVLGRADWRWTDLLSARR